MLPHRSIAAAFCVASLGLGCRAPEGPPLREAASAPWDDELLAIAGSYRSWIRVSDANWAPWQCFLPPPSGALRSASADDATHGRKLYFLFTREDDEHFYRWILPAGMKSPMGRQEDGPAPVGFAIVKESWAPVDVDPTTVPPPDPPRPGEPEEFPPGRRFPPEYALEGDKAFRTGDPRGLFILLKTDPATPDTDEGWVYGTVTADGKTVTSSGRVASCMGCHANASRDRLFGMHAGKDKQ